MTTNQDTKKGLEVDATPVPPGGAGGGNWGGELTFTLVFDADGQVVEVKDREGRRCEGRPIPEQLRIHAEHGMQPVTLLPMTLIRHKNLETAKPELACCVLLGGIWRKIC